MFFNPNAKILLKGRTLEAFPLKSGTKQEFPLQSALCTFSKIAISKTENEFIIFI